MNERPDHKPDCPCSACVWADLAAAFGRLDVGDGKQADGVMAFEPLPRGWEWTA